MSVGTRAPRGRGVRRFGLQRSRTEPALPESRPELPILKVTPEGTFVPAQDRQIEVFVVAGRSVEEEVDRASAGDPPGAGDGLEELSGRPG